MTILAGIDIGGTKCAVCLGREWPGGMEITAKESFRTPPTPQEALSRLIEALHVLMKASGAGVPAAVGISCGGPLDSRRGLVLSPPNLPGWDNIDATGTVQSFLGIPAFLQNDANACALAEWKWGAGQGLQHLLFLTFGTGMGAGLILNGQLYRGASDLAGEVGHIRLAPDGPEGYGKHGSFEAFCSGGGISRLAVEMVHDHVRRGGSTRLYSDKSGFGSITAGSVADAALAGDRLAKKVYCIAAQYLGQGLAILVDILNPERIIIGSVYGRQRQLLEEPALDILSQEALPLSLQACEIVPAGLGDAVGDYGSLAAASYGLTT